MTGDKDTELLKRRFIELARKSEHGYFTFTDFLGLSEQSAFSEIKKELGRTEYTLFGGVEGAERVMIRFGSEDELGYSEPFPIAALVCRPRSPKFAEALTHRDFLGSILALGIERSLIGDIAVGEEETYIFVKEDMADYIISSLTRVRRTDVLLLRAKTVPEGRLYRTERIGLQAVGERLDAIVAKVFHISRDDSLSLFKKHLVFLGGRVVENNSLIPKKDDVISVRGYGRFIYRGYGTLSKKGKLNIVIDLYV